MQYNYNGRCSKFPQRLLEDKVISNRSAGSVKLQLQKKTLNLFLISVYVNAVVTFQNMEDPAAAVLLITILGTAEQ